MEKSTCFKCVRCGGNQISHDFLDHDLFHYNKDKPQGEQWESFVWFEFSCLVCDENWTVKCEVNPISVER